MVEAIEWVEACRTYGRLAVWMPLKVYFYTVAVKFRDQVRVGEGSANGSFRELVFVTRSSREEY